MKDLKLLQLRDRHFDLQRNRNLELNTGVIKKGNLSNP